MKILHIIAGELSGGAAKGAYNLHNGLLSLGIDSKIYTNSNITYNDPTVTSISKSKKEKLIYFLRNQLQYLLLKFYPRKKDRPLSSGIFGKNFLKSKEYNEADIINLHWINANFINMKDLKNIKKPIVWTIRDMWPMTGGCHYSMECKRYETGCGQCPELDSKSDYDLSKFILYRKEKYLPKNMKIVCISTWLEECARKSKLFKNFDVRAISNNIDSTEINTTKKIILVGSTSLKDFYKGFSKYLEAIKQLDKNNYFLIFFGNLDKTIIETLGFEYKNFGYMNDSISLNLIYNSADVFVAPSIMDAFGKTITESMSCKTPVVCFDATGPKDIVSHRIDGYKAKPFDSTDLKDGIEWIINNTNYDELSKNARNKIIKNFDNKIVAQKYILLYKEMLK
jgi:glycosyltransferase involved in cell wall biosynthesis